jgi:hypothetical protein
MLHPPPRGNRETPRSLDHARSLDGPNGYVSTEAGHWFFANLDGDNSAAKDKIKDLSAEEFRDDLDFILNGDREF